ncbi:hypothetical protein AAE478_005197 [Parahypoxylon ruwenzoriense]
MQCHRYCAPSNILVVVVVVVVVVVIIIIIIIMKQRLTFTPQDDFNSNGIKHVMEN